MIQKIFWLPNFLFYFYKFHHRIFAYLTNDFLFTSTGSCVIIYSIKSLKLRRLLAPQERMTALETVYAIELRNITKRFGSVVANDGICLGLRRGEILSLLGENGSGKTTLMNMLAGIYLPDEGEILADGKPISIRSPKDAFDHKIGMIHQHYKLVDVFTAAENIVLGLDEGGRLDIKATNAKVKEICDRYGFDIDPTQKIYDMSVRTF